MGRKKSGASHPLVKFQPTARDLEIYSKVIKLDRTYADIGSDYSLTPQRIQQIVEEVDKWLVPQHMDRIRQIMSRQTATLNHISHQMMAAWEKSKFPPIEEIDTVSSGDDDGKTTHTVKRKSTCGDTAYIDRAIKALAEIRRIWGAEAKTAPELEDGIRAAGIPYEEAVAKYIEEQKEILDRLLPSLN